ncbi:TPA: CaiF/GrlA family transcriptional regulator [Escherichia coli]|nr:CaiF/GrlA family transcriptional regulator [Escherichia coli]
MPERRRRIKRHFFCPECVQDMQARPLYLIVTFWGMRTGRLLTVEAVSREFHITQRTAKIFCITLNTRDETISAAGALYKTNRQLDEDAHCGSWIYRIRRKSRPVQELNWMFSWNLLPPQQSSHSGH